MSAIPAPIFEALIVPHRSLTRKGATIVVGIVAIVSSGIGLRLWLWGAWPAVIFSLIDAPLLLLLLMLNWHRGRASELIMLTEDRFTVIRTDARGSRRQMSLPTAWLRVDMQSADAIPRIVVARQGKTWEVGAFLHDADKRSLFGALRDALDRAHNPRFDNPQLRDG